MEKQVLEERLSYQNCNLYHNHTLILYPHLFYPVEQNAPPTAIPPLEGRSHLRQFRYKLPICKDHVLSSAPPKPPNIPKDTKNPPYEPAKIKDKPVEVDAIEADLNTDFGKNAQQYKGITVRYMTDQERNTCKNHWNCTHRLAGRV